VHTVSRKSERLVNLTIALLATRRYLTKSEIFRTVAGYEGEAEARDRMFERDKEDLRSLGIDLELGSHDALFNDEAGYRIKPERYSIQLSDLTPLEMLLLSKAADVWRDASLSGASSTGLRKLKALGLDSDTDEIPDLTARFSEIPEQLLDVIEALSSRREIGFDYVGAELVAKPRKVWPYHLSYSHNHWYLLAFDIDQQDIRRFRLDRFSSAISFYSPAQHFPADNEGVQAVLADVAKESLEARVSVRVGRGAKIRRNSHLISSDGEWDLLKVPYYDMDELIFNIIWLGDDARVESPNEMREQVIASVENLVRDNG
jgi:proteasome accessory factor B